MVKLGRKRKPAATKAESSTGQQTRATKIPTTIVCGPPGAGKSKFILDRFRYGDLFIGDGLCAALSGIAIHDPQPSTVFAFQSAATWAVFKMLHHGEIPLAEENGLPDAAWIENRWPGANERRDLSKFLDADVMVLETPASECMEHIRQDERRLPETYGAYEEAIAEWWQDYEPSEADIIIKGQGPCSPLALRGASFGRLVNKSVPPPISAILPMLNIP